MKEAQKKKDEELEIIKKIQTELNQKRTEDREIENVNEILKTIWPKWNVTHMMNEVVKSVEEYWLNPKYSFEIENKWDCHMDLLMTAEAFLFRVFPSTIGVVLPNATTKKKAFQIL